MAFLFSMIVMACVIVVLVRCGRDTGQTDASSPARTDATTKSTATNVWVSRRNLLRRSRPASSQQPVPDIRWSALDDHQLSRLLSETAQHEPEPEGLDRGDADQHGSAAEDDK